MPIESIFDTLIRYFSCFHNQKNHDIDTIFFFNFVNVSNFGENFMLLKSKYLAKSLSTLLILLDDDLQDVRIWPKAIGTIHYNQYFEY